MQKFGISATKYNNDRLIFLNHCVIWVCSNLHTGAQLYSTSYYGEGSGPIYIGGSCSGSESRLEDCGVISASYSDHHSQDVGIHCFEQGKLLTQTYIRTYFHIYTFRYMHAYCDPEQSFKLFSSSRFALYTVYIIYIYISTIIHGSVTDVVHIYLHYK